jgi:hypothetical protein
LSMCRISVTSLSLVMTSLMYLQAAGSLSITSLPSDSGGETRHPIPVASPFAWNRASSEVEVPSVCQSRI